MTALDWLRVHLLVAIEFKKEDNRNVKEVWNKQLRAYLRESTRRPIAIGMLYDTERLYIFRQIGNTQIRFSDEYNQKGEQSKATELSLHLSDPYSNIPSFATLIAWNNQHEIDRSTRTIEDLDIITGIHSTQINDAMSAILRTMDKVGLVNESGFQILIQILSIKIYDEKENERTPSRHLKFYIASEERTYSSLADTYIQCFITRFKSLLNDAQGVYRRILKEQAIDFKNESHIKILIEIVSQFQNFSFVRSHKTDLYQLVFYKFASPFSKEYANFISIINDEITNNQKYNSFSFSFPSFSELSANSRLDAKFYSPIFKETDFFIRNYKYGTKSIKELGFKMSRGQNLQVSKYRKKRIFI